MALIGLGYIGVDTRRPDEWDTFAAGLLGMQQVDRTRTRRAFRMDDRRQRLLVHADRPDGLGFLGFEVEGADDLERIAARLEASATRVDRGVAALADERHVAGLVGFDDPSGNRVELFHGAEEATEAFVPGRPISGFRTGAFGMGHVVLNVADIDRLLPFYRDVLGFRVSDFGHQPYKLYFFHLNRRHHSFAMIGSGRRSIHHFMVELGSLDDVGQGYDLAQADPGRVAYTLGRHANDHMTSFYAHTPSGFFVEYGWGGRLIEPATWQPHETTDGPSLWGHDRLYDMPADQRDRLKAMRFDAAARGVRAPHPPIDCPWLDRVAAAR